MDFFNSSKILIPKKKINKAIIEVSDTIYNDYKEKSLVVLCVLNGALRFFNDLMYNLTSKYNDNITYDFIKLSSYGMDTKSNGIINLTLDTSINIKDKDILIVEDIVDTGNTIRYLIEHLKPKNPKSIKIATLLYKKGSIDNNFVIDYKCFKVNNYFVVGYGLDYREKYRNLNDIYRLVIDNEK